MDDDARFTEAVIQELGDRPDWLIVDHYSLDARWESAIRPLVRRIMAIDDLANRAHDCDLLLDQNLVDQPQTRYRGKLPLRCSKLFGPQYALLQPEYARLRASVTIRSGRVRRILIFFGGTDTQNFTELAASACMAFRNRDLEIDLVVTSANPHAALLRDRVRNRAEVRMHVDLPTLAPLMSRADLAIGAAGTTTWERLCLGLPTLVVSIAENQRAVAAELHRRGLIRWLGHKDEVGNDALSAALADVMAQGLDASWSQRCLEAVDGMGTQRVCNALLISSATPLSVRAVNKEDEELLLEWANDPVTRGNGMHPGPIRPEAHRSWLRERLRRPTECRFYIVETADSIPIGQVRFQRADQGWELHYAIAPTFRGRGLGRTALASALSRLRADAEGGVIFGRVKPENLSSRRIFESLGFVSDTDGRSETLVYRTHLRD